MTHVAPFGVAEVPVTLWPMQMGNVARSALPLGVVEWERNRRLLRRLGAASTRPALAATATATRLDLLPPGALKGIRTAVDVGANEGRWSSGVLRLTRPVRLIAVEPSPQLLPSLRSTLAPFDNAVVVAAAVGATPGETTFNVTAHSHSASVLPPRTGEMDRIYGFGYEVVEQVTVPMTTLDELTADLAEVSLLKIDVQGFESAVLAGATAALTKTRWLLIEVNFRSHYEGDLLFPELHERLAAAGFRLTGMSAPLIQAGVALWADSLYENAAPLRA